MSQIEIVILGTASMIPTKDRNPTSVFVSYDDTAFLFDCAEGSQRQMKIAGIRPNRVRKIFITHWHGDHVLGLGGLIQTLGNSDYEGTLEIYGPIGSKKYFEHLTQSFAFDTPIDLKIIEVSDGTIFENNEFYIVAKKLSHSIPCIGYRFVEKDKRKMIPSKLEKYKITGPLVGKLQMGKSIIHNKITIKPEDVSVVEQGKTFAFVTDTEVCENITVLASNADLLLSEATYHSDLEDKAHEYKHMTAKQAATIASNNNVKKLILTHISGRYKTSEEIEAEAKDIFPNTICAFDFMKIKL